VEGTLHAPPKAPITVIVISTAKHAVIAFDLRVLRSFKVPGIMLDSPLSEP